jgi:hypothetical protein
MKNPQESEIFQVEIWWKFVNQKKKKTLQVSA